MKNLTNPLTVSDLTHLIRSAVEREFSDVLVTGEISNFIRHSSGHYYFTLKDARAELAIVMFRGNNRFLRFEVENGMQVTISGKISIYENRGRLQLIARTLEPAGVGTLYMAFEALKKKLEKEGLFREERKKPVLEYPERVGVITSPSGAAVRDIFQILKRRAPYVRVVFRPTQVQGESAAADIARALEEIASIGNADVIILGRGGGSIEDLWAFNEEAVVRAISECPIPVISAVGHETDFTLSDLVSDLRAATPSAAAELVAPSIMEIQELTVNLLLRMVNSIEYKMNIRWQQLDSAAGRLETLKPHRQIARKRDNLELLAAQILNRMQYRLSQIRSTVDSYFARLEALNPASVLERGYSIAYSIPERKIIRSNLDIPDNSSFELQTGKGSFKAVKIQNIQPDDS